LTKQQLPVLDIKVINEIDSQIGWIHGNTLKNIENVLQASELTYSYLQSACRFLEKASILSKFVDIR
jgi:hypothetical protein